MGDYRLSARINHLKDLIIDLGDGIVFNTQNTVLIAGPCAVETKEQIFASAEFLKSIGIKVFRAGAFKPRTNPYSFQGSEYEGLRWLGEIKKKYGMKIVTEVKDSTHIDAVSEVADIIQIGAKSMFNHAVLKACGKLKKPVMLKRFFSATIEEFLQMADFILKEGNEKVILCERGIRTFEPMIRFSLDLSSSAVVKRESYLPLVLDPSHGIGLSFGVPDLARASAAFGCNGLLIEVHPCVEKALCDKNQALDHQVFSGLKKDLEKICLAVGRNLI